MLYGNCEGVVMKYEQIQRFSEYEDIFQKKIKYCRHINPDSAYCIFLDGKDAVKHHDQDMMSDTGYAYRLMCVARLLLNKYNVECHLFSIMDEILFLFPSGKDLMEVFGEDTEDCILSLVVAEFSMLSRSYNTGLVKGICYPVEKKDISKTVEFRRVCGFACALEYFAKEKLAAHNYRNKSEEQLIQVLKEKKLYDDFLSLGSFHSGYEHIRGKDEFFIPEPMKNTSSDNTSPVGYEFDK